MRYTVYFYFNKISLVFICLCGAHTFYKHRFHVLVVGTEECERSIAQSAVNPSKKLWESVLHEVTGEHYAPIRSHTLQV